MQLSLFSSLDPEGVREDPPKIYRHIGLDIPFSIKNAFLHEEQVRDAANMRSLGWNTTISVSQ
jgi:hypothetical protein